LSIYYINKIGCDVELKNIEHIGIAVHNIEESLKYYEGVLGLKCYAIEDVEEQKVKTAFLKIGETKLELLEATSDDSPVAKFIEKRGEGVHHIAFAVNKIEDALAQAGEKGIRLIDENPRKGAEGLDIAFLHPKSTGGVLTEFCEKKQ
jgi:methylmalonyl-CoA/ethylmalonyl-CoA epimerase